MMDLTKIDQPFETLDIETKLALHRAHYEGKVLEANYGSGEFEVWPYQKFYNHITYRLQPDPEASQAALAKAFCMGRDAAAETCWSVKDESDYRYWGGDANAHAVRINLTGKQRSIRALLPPADLAAKIGGE